MAQKIQACSALALLMLLAGCASFGLAPANTLSERLAYAMGSHTAVLAATTQALDAGDITSDDAQRVLTVADTARQTLDAAGLAIGVGDLATAEARLQLATSLLARLQSYLRGAS